MQTDREFAREPRLAAARSQERPPAHGSREPRNSRKLRRAEPTETELRRNNLGKMTELTPANLEEFAMSGLNSWFSKFSLQSRFEVKQCNR